MADVINPTPRICPKDCRKCPMQQQMFCSAQLSFNAFEVMNGIIMRLDEIESSVRCLNAQKGDLAFPDEARIIEDKTQVGSGVIQ